MNKPLWNGRLYREGLRQSRTIGLATIIILTLVGLLGPTVIALTIRSNVSPEELALLQPQTMNLARLFPCLPAVMYIAVPAILFYLFRFLNKRSGSDFYHSLPQTRLCVMNSFFLSAMTWIVLAVVISVGGVIGLSWGLSRYIQLNLASVTPMLLNTLAGCLLGAGAVMIAISLTGTAFSGLLMTAMIVFLPRLFLLVGAHTLLSLSEMFVSMPGMNYGYNVLFGVLMGPLLKLLIGGSISDLFFNSLWPALYSAVLGLLYLGLAAVLYVRRRSETASKAAANSRVQAVNRIAFSLVFCLLPMVWLVGNICGGGDPADWLPAGVVFYALALIAYFLYELVTTRRARNLLKIFPGLGVLVGIHILSVLALVLIYRVEINYCPDVADMKSVSIAGKYDEEDYFSVMNTRIRIEDPEALQLVHDSLAKGIRNEDELEHYTPYALQVTIRSSRGDRVRYLRFTEDDYQKLFEILGKQTAYREIYQELPDASVIMESYLGLYGFYGDKSVPAEAAMTIYEVLRQEIQTVDFDTWLSACISGSHGEAMADLQLVVREGPELYNLRLSVYDFMPKTAAAIVQAFNQTHESDKTKILEKLANAGEEVEKQIDGYGYWIQGENIYLYLDEAMGRDLAEVLQQPAPKDSCYLMLRYMTNERKDGQWVAYSYIFEVDPAQVPWDGDSPVTEETEM